MRGFWRELNDFFSSTSIHGFPYISDTQSMSTRIIWTIIVLAGFGVASYFLYNTVDGFSDKYVTTTVETRKIQDYPFPAVTFYPGAYNSNKSFMRDFLNDFEFTRYDYGSSLRANEKFMDLYQWLISPMNDDLFDDVEAFLIRNGSYLEGKASQQSEEVCKLVGLHQNNISLKKEIRDIFLVNMYKFRVRSADIWDEVIQEQVREAFNKKKSFSY